MQGFIDSGEHWMIPLRDFRNRLKAVRELDDWRMTRRKNGVLGPGPFLPERRIQLLEELLQLEQQVKHPLIIDQEIAYIQAVWAREFDLNDSALALAKKYGRKITQMSELQLPKMEQQVLDDLVAEYGINPDLVEKLLKLVIRDYNDLTVWGSKAGFKRDIEKLIEASLAQEEMTDTSA